MYSYANSPQSSPLLSFIIPAAFAFTIATSCATTLGPVRTAPPTCEASAFVRTVSDDSGINHLQQDYNGITYSANGGTFMPNRMEINIRKLQSFSSLCNNWNGYNASPIKSNAIEKALQIVNALSIQPQVFPVADGSVQLEFDNPNGSYLEIVIGNDDEVEYFEQKPDGSETEGSFKYDLDRIIRMVYSING